MPVEERLGSFFGCRQASPPQRSTNPGFSALRSHDPYSASIFSFISTQFTRLQIQEGTASSCRCFFFCPPLQLLVGREGFEPVSPYPRRVIKWQDALLTRLAPNKTFERLGRVTFEKYSLRKAGCVVARCAVYLGGRPTAQEAILDKVREGWMGNCGLAPSFLPIRSTSRFLPHLPVNSCLPSLVYPAFAPRALSLLESPPVFLVISPR
jgi:hypothetical protein